MQAWKEPTSLHHYLTIKNIARINQLIRQTKRERKKLVKFFVITYPRVGIISLIMTVIYLVFVTVIHFHTSLTFTSMAGAYLHCKT